jgi:hypothetical protein
MGTNKHSEVSSGAYRKITVINDGTYFVGFVNIYDKIDTLQPIPVTNYLKEDDSIYASIESFESTVSEFFISTSSNSGSGGGPGGSSTLWAWLAAGVEGQTVFSLPLDVDETANKTNFHVSREGIVPIAEDQFSISLVGNVPTITFTVPFTAEEAGNTPYVGYPTKTTDLIVKVRDENGNDSISRIKTKKFTVTLPASQAPYSAGDVITDISGTLSAWLNVAKAAGYGVTLVGLRVQTTDATGLAGKNLRFHIFNDSIAAIADNAVFSIADSNTDKREGTISVTIGTGTMSKVGASNYENINLNPVGTSVYCIVEDVDGHTPSANSTVINVYLKFIQGN